MVEIKEIHSERDLKELLDGKTIEQCSALGKIFKQSSISLNIAKEMLSKFPDIKTKHPGATPKNIQPAAKKASLFIEKYLETRTE